MVDENAGAAKTITIHYLYTQDAWYFPDVSLNVYRTTIDQIDPSFLAHMLNLTASQLDRLMPFLRTMPSDIVHAYELTFSDDIVHDN